jgi:dihydroorotase-like cyclic amidohydrolase
MPGAIDDQVHFRARTCIKEILNQNQELLLRITSFIEQPNTVLMLLPKKFLNKNQLAAEKSYAIRL